MAPAGAADGQNAAATIDAAGDTGAGTTTTTDTTSTTATSTTPTTTTSTTTHTDDDYTDDDHTDDDYTDDDHSDVDDTDDNDIDVDYTDDDHVDDAPRRPRRPPQPRPRSRRRRRPRPPRRRSRRRRRPPGCPHDDGQHCAVRVPVQQAPHSLPGRRGNRESKAEVDALRGRAPPRAPERPLRADQSRARAGLDAADHDDDEQADREEAALDEEAESEALGGRRLEGDRPGRRQPTEAPGRSVEAVGLGAPAAGRELPGPPFLLRSTTRRPPTTASPGRSWPRSTRSRPTMGATCRSHRGRGRLDAVSPIDVGEVRGQRRWRRLANPYDPVDAIFSAARYLRAAGAEGNLAGRSSPTTTRTGT